MLTEHVSGLSWLNYGQGFGLETPMVLDLGLLVLTFGLTIRISIASIIGMVLAIIIYRICRAAARERVLPGVVGEENPPPGERERRNHETTMKDLYKEERPYEKCLACGPGALSDPELLAVILRTGSAGETVCQLQAAS